MGWWFRSVRLAVGERLVYQAAANGFQGVRVVGGRLHVSDRRIIFLPNRLDSVTWGKEWEIPRSDVIDVEVLKPGPRAVKQRGFGAAFRRQVAIKFIGGAYVITVRDADALLEKLAESGNSDV